MNRQNSPQKTGRPTFQAAGLLPALIFLLIGCVALGRSAPDDRLLILIKIDGLSAVFLEAALNPESQATDRLPEPDLFRISINDLQEALDREDLFPNLRHYFLRQGVRVESMYSATLPLSAVAWGVIDSGQPSVIKNHFYFNRISGEMYGYLDGLNEGLALLLRGAGKTTALWQLDLLAVPILGDYFEADRSFFSMQLFYRQRPHEQLSNLGKFLVKAGEREPRAFEVIKRQLSRFAYHPDFPEWNDEALSQLAANRILNSPVPLQFINLLFTTLDHEFHVDPDYRRLLTWMMKVDRWIGEILRAVERSPRRDQTIVAVVSDHGLDFHPTLNNYPFPMNRWYREPSFGSHTVFSPHTEGAVHAVTVPIRGVDRARIYEARQSPYGPSRGGERGYFTAFTAHAGNPRFDTFLRNSSINELHLILLEAKRLSEEGARRELEQLASLFAESMHAARGLLERELVGLDAAISQLSRLAELYAESEDEYSKDSRRRLQTEVDGYRRQREALRRLVDFPTSPAEWVQSAQQGIQLPALIPKGYLGPPNELHQLRSYVVGWERDEAGRWKDGLPAFRRLDYPELFTIYRATNPNSYGNPYPFNFFSASVPLEKAGFEFDRPLRQLIWVALSAGRGEVLLAESDAGEIAWFPVELQPSTGAQYPFRQVNADPLGYGSDSAGLWLHPREWTSRTGRLEFSNLPVILTDLFRKNYELYLDAQAFASKYQDSGRIDVDRIRETLRYRFASGETDFRTWLNPGWNTNTKSHTPGGTHGGFNPIETQTVFMAWGGDEIDIRRNETVSGAFLTYDILPTLLRLMGIEQDPEQHRYPGRPLPIFRSRDFLHLSSPR